MSYNTDQIQKLRNDIINCQPDHLKALVNGAINVILIHYDSEIKTALYNLYEAVPKQTEDAAWWNDDLTDAMEAAKKLI